MIARAQNFVVLRAIRGGRNMKGNMNEWPCNATTRMFGELGKFYFAT